MAVHKGSRKGKKAWRRNIDTQDVEEAQAEKTLRQRQGPAARDLPDSKLFFVDQAPSTSHTVHQLSSGRKAKQHKLLRSQAILQASHSAKPVKLTNKRKHSTDQRQADKLISSRQAGAVPGATAAALDIWGDGAVAPQKRRKTGPLTVTAIQPVEVDKPGSSYNPDPEQQQEALAEAEAAEVAKTNKPLLQATAPPRSLPLVLGHDEDELALLQVEEDTEAADVSEAEADGDAPTVAPEQRKKTKAERNKQKRLQQLHQEEDERRTAKQRRRDLAMLPQLQAEVAAREAESERRRLRRATVRAEKALVGPGHLGKLKYLPPAVQVLLREEVGGGLRSLKAAPTVLKERFNALQRRGLIETRLPMRGRRPGRRIAYKPGDRADRAREAQAELDSLRKKKHA